MVMRSITIYLILIQPSSSTPLPVFSHSRHVLLKLDSVLNWFSESPHSTQMPLEDFLALCRTRHMSY